MVKIALKKANSVDQQEALHRVIDAAREGCILHQLYLEGRIDDSHFQAGLAFAKLYHLAMRSFGIHNRIRSACQTWEQFHGIAYDPFSNTKIEGLWRYILKALNPIYHQGVPMHGIALSLVLTTTWQKQYSLINIRKTLEYLSTIWEKIESSPYRLGLYAFKQQRLRARLH
jgi:hypothetical protein